MGNNLLRACGKRRRESPVFDENDYEKSTVAAVYLPGSLEYLEHVGMDRVGRIIKVEDEKKPKLHTEQNIKNVFDEYCRNYFDLNNLSNYKSYNGMLTFQVFLRLYKTAFFWKKIRFE